MEIMEMDKKSLYVGDDVSGLKIYEIINKYFGKKYKAWMRAWYDINDDYAAWFPTITETNERPNGAYGGTRNCSNTLSEDRSTITEIDHDDTSLVPNEPSKLSKNRLVFGRINGSFEFLGIFQRTISKEGNQIIKTHHKIADGINLETFKLLKY